MSTLDESRSLVIRQNGVSIGERSVRNDNPTRLTTGIKLKLNVPVNAHNFSMVYSPIIIS